MSNLAPGAPSSDPSGHLLPAGEKGSEATAACSPFSPRGEGARRADEGAPGATKIIRPDIRKHRPAKTTQARQLRQNETEEEYHLWSDLRARRLDGYKFARQVPLGPFIVDFLCREARLVVEIDGFQHAESAADQSRTVWLNNNGYSVLRFWNHEISRERRSVLETILAALQGRIEFNAERPSFYSPAEKR
ncbi:endonuclease domain-containing protein [Rhizobium sp. AN80A]|uniref:endonuclease domain-containing protein n=1 Tax=Rhizobium sp. AN80A TaxID=3040673 RepID=UPI0024B3BC28|nr:endonuclease domain-containing protein [Rhizobium sp. AN80A]